MSRISKKNFSLKMPDRSLLIDIGLLISVGFIALSSASVAQSQRVFGNVYGYLAHQFLFGTLLGLVLGLVLYFMPHELLKKVAFPFYLVSLFFLVLVFVPPFSHGAGGAQRWITLGTFTFQPSEFVKLSFVIYLAAWLESRKKIIKDAEKGLVPFLILVGVLAIFLILQPDVSTLGIVAITAAFMYLAGGGKLSHLGIMLASGLAMLFVLVKATPYRFQRILTFLHPQTDPLGISYQINQALLAIGSGGLLGLGIGASRNAIIIPESMGDSIFAVWSQETGFIGSIVLLVLFVFFAWRGLRIARSAPDRFLSLAAVGIVTWITMQAFVNIGSSVGVLPITGLSLPFISYGGTSMIAVLGASGFLLHISRYATREKA